MAPGCSWCAVLLLFCTSICFAIDNASTCESSADTRNALMCESLFETLENSLLSNGSNLYKLKKLFYTDPPELARISYYLKFQYNWLNKFDDFDGSGTSGELPTSDTKLPLCSCAGSSILNQTIYMYNNETIILRYGWAMHHWFVHFYPPSSS